MSRGESGRIVVEVAPELKRELYAALALSGSTLKDWFVRNAENFCAHPSQRGLFDSSSDAGPAAHDKSAIVQSCEKD